MNPDRNHELFSYLQSVHQSFPQRSVESMVLLHGRSYPVPSQARPFGIARGIAKQCYRNALDLAVQRHYQYVEGFATNSIGVHMQHAWVLNHRGIVVETTWQTPALAYFGIELSVEMVCAIRDELHRYGAIDLHSPTFVRHFVK